MIIFQGPWISLDFSRHLEQKLGLEVERSLKEKGELRDGGGRINFYVFREVEFSTRTERKMRED